MIRGIFMKNAWENILLIAGSGRNVGKTSYICNLLKEHKSRKPVAVKISPHFHKTTEGLRLISETSNYQLFEETNRETTKDSSLYLQHGAARSFYMQADDEHLTDAFLSLMPFLEADKPILIESAALHKYIQAGLFLFIYNEKSADKPSTKTNLKIADLVVRSNGPSFSHSPSSLKFEQTWKINH